ncbi:MAG: DNA polymerase III subunit delta [Microcystis sp. LE17-20A]|jgi:DNA polymerase-3 subunit delta|uniref:DNA polymerase III subunit delta n=1 Tax=unclassified Microcystis TaxID=2643300 RepID=UPI0022C3C533|nr:MULTISPECIES: DNA polymerase III subunit delta [unclassified Microcystis]MCZ8039568.1 DNA polymerase III subunit delta [Microcystis sp. LE17-20A]MCZ8212137.1 DNA polymerase III subunit delta [Microcystis sp. LE19-8.1F]
MPTIFYWGEDEFAINQAVKNLQVKLLDPNWIQFNYDKINGDRHEAIIEAFNQAMTPVFGMGNRLVWLADTVICQQCSEDILKELQRTLPNLPENSYLLLTSAKKPDSRLKSSKFIQNQAEVKEFELIPPWKVEEIAQRVREIAKEVGVKLTPDAIELLAEAVGNNSRLLWMELEKLRLFKNNSAGTIDKKDILSLVNASNQSSLQLASAILKRETGKSLELVNELLNRNENPLAITATLGGQFRTWAIVKLKIEEGEKDEKNIAAAAEIANPKRLYFIRKEIQSFSSKQLLATLPILLELEYRLKRGAEPLATLQTKIIELCCLLVT